MLPKQTFINLGCLLLISNLIQALPTSSPSENVAYKKPKQDDGDVGDDGDETDAAGAGGAAGAAGAIAGGLQPGNYITGTYNNVGTILGGIATGNFGNILSGGTAFIPPGDLRTGIDVVIQNGLVPLVQRVTQDVGQTIQRGFNQTQSSSAAGLSRRRTTPPPSFFEDPLKAIQNRLQGGGNGGNPLAEISNRLQSLFQMQPAPPPVAAPVAVSNVVGVRPGANVGASIAAAAGGGQGTGTNVVKIVANAQNRNRVNNINNQRYKQGVLIPSSPLYNQRY